MLDAPGAQQNNDQVIESTLRAISKHAKNIKMVYVLLADTDSGVYNRIKFVGDVLLGLHTVCSLYDKASNERGQDMYLANIALKVNCKLRGVNQSLAPSELGIIGHGKTMVVGIDVTHPSPGSLSTAPSVAAVVASTDGTLGQFPCELSAQEGRVEMVAQLTAMVCSRLRLWQQKNKTLPENVLVYRDGVSEGQYMVLQVTEIPALRAAFDLLYTPAQRKSGVPNLAVVVVGKRHHTRFYPTQVGEADRSGNTVNGTVVDRGVTSIWNWDFFLQAHTGLQGTVKPAHYYVVLDEIFANPQLKKLHPFANAADTLEDLTHKMCYLFARATKAVSICPPAYYADLACERARAYLSEEFDPASAGGSIASGATQPVPQDAHSKVRIHEAIRDSMFYI